MTIRHNSNEVIAALQDKVSSAFAPAKLRYAGVRIGLLLSNAMKVKNREVLRVRTGYLINSLQYRLVNLGDGRMEVEAGSFGVPYARIHEFGYHGVMQIRAHARKGTNGVRAHSRNVNLRARPYVQPAFESSKQKIMEIVEGLLK